MGVRSFPSAVVLCAPLLLLSLGAKPQPRMLQVGGGAAPAGMQEFNTQHYRIHTDLDPELARDLARRLDVMYDAYSYRLRLFTFALEHRYTDLALTTDSRLDPLTFTGNQILFRVGRKFGMAR